MSGRAPTATCLSSAAVPRAWRRPSPPVDRERKSFSARMTSALAGACSQSARAWTASRRSRGSKASRLNSRRCRTCAFSPAPRWSPHSMAEPMRRWSGFRITCLSRRPSRRASASGGLSRGGRFWRRAPANDHWRFRTTTAQGSCSPAPCGPTSIASASPSAAGSLSSRRPMMAG